MENNMLNFLQKRLLEKGEPNNPDNYKKQTIKTGLTSPKKNKDIEPGTPRVKPNDLDKVKYIEPLLSPLGRLGKERSIKDSVKDLITKKWKGNRFLFNPELSNIRSNGMDMTGNFYLSDDIDPSDSDFFSYLDANWDVILQELNRRYSGENITITGNVYPFDSFSPESPKSDNHVYINFLYSNPVSNIAGNTFIPFKISFSHSLK